MITAFVLSGGRSLGAVQVGMLQALTVRGIEPDLLVGTSTGALNAACVAAHGVSEASLDDLEAIWFRLRRRDVVPLQPDTGRWLDKGGPRLARPERFLSLHRHTFPMNPASTSCHGGQAA